MLYRETWLVNKHTGITSERGNKKNRMRLFIFLCIYYFENQEETWVVAIY